MRRFIDLHAEQALTSRGPIPEVVLRLGEVDLGDLGMDALAAVVQRAEPQRVPVQAGVGSRER
jgi:hypothetical protein